VDPGNLANNVWSTGFFRYDEKQKIFSSYVQGNEKLRARYTPLNSNALNHHTVYIPTLFVMIPYSLVNKRISFSCGGRRHVLNSAYLFDHAHFYYAVINAGRHMDLIGGIKSRKASCACLLAYKCAPDAPIIGQIIMTKQFPLICRFSGKQARKVYVCV
jgi:hypothetical protein